MVRDASDEPKKGDPSDVVIVPKFLLITIFGTPDWGSKRVYATTAITNSKITTTYPLKIKNSFGYYY